MMFRTRPLFVGLCASLLFVAANGCNDSKPATPDKMKDGKMEEGKMKDKMKMEEGKMKMEEGKMEGKMKMEEGKMKMEK